MAQSDDLSEKMDQLRYLQNVYNQQYELLNNEIASYSLARDAIGRNIEFLDKGVGLHDFNMLMNVEGGVYFAVNAKDVKKVLAYVGGGYLVEMGLEDARKFAEENRNKSDAVMNRLLSDKRKLEDELVKISYQLAAIQQE